MPRAPPHKTASEDFDINLLEKLKKIMAYDALGRGTVGVKRKISFKQLFSDKTVSINEDQTQHNPNITLTSS